MSETLKLIQLIEERPCLYNHKSDNYSNKQYTDIAWNEISNEIKWAGMYICL